MLRRYKTNRKRFINSILLSLGSFIKRDHYYNRTEVEMIIIYGAFIFSISWILLGHIGICHLNHVDYYSFRLIIALALIYYWFIVYFKKFNLFHHILWIVYNLLSSIVFPFYLYLANNRDTYSFGTILFLTIYYASLTRSLDTFISLTLGLAGTYFLFRDALIYEDYIVFLSIFFTYLITSVPITSLRYFRIKDEKRKRELEIVLKEKEEAESHFAKIETMASLGSLVSEITEEINNPLVEIHGIANQLKNSHDNCLVHEAIWEKHNNAIQQIAIIIQNLQNYSSQNTSEKESLTLAKLMEHKCDSIKSIKND